MTAAAITSATNHRAKAMMVLGTSSHVGKSLVTAALCRILARRGVRVAPFKSQNMSLNSAATVEGLEIGRAQALQAEAAGVAPSVDMNPILIKPSGGGASQVVARGRIWGQVSAADYHLRRVEELMPVVRASYAALAEQYDVVVIEGAGSPVEINLKQHDIVNMRIAAMADASCILVADIDRGGVFASLLGTIELLEPAERDRIGGFLINKFRGDVALLEPGIRMIEARLGKRCLGVVPFLHALALEEEDSVGMPTARFERWSTPAAGAAVSDRRLRIVVIALPSFSNFTDFDALQAEPSLEVQFARSVEALVEADVVIVPGSKQTMDDLAWMRMQGLDAAVIRHASTSLVLGICGGMQMLGESIRDEAGVERMGMVAGLGLLPIETTMQAQKVTRNIGGVLCEPRLFSSAIDAPQVRGYEIHVGETRYLDGAIPFAMLEDERGGLSHRDGCWDAVMRVMGTYLHGLFEEDGFRHQFVQAARAAAGLSRATVLTPWKTRREESLERLADEVERAVDLRTIFEWADLGPDRAQGDAA